MLLWLYVSHTLWIHFLIKVFNVQGVLSFFTEHHTFLKSKAVVNFTPICKALYFRKVLIYFLYSINLYHKISFLSIKIHIEKCQIKNKSGRETPPASFLVRPPVENSSVQPCIGLCFYRETQK